MRDPVLTSRAPVGVLDAFRVPYASERSARANLVGPAGTISWPEAGSVERPALRGYELDGTPLFASLLGGPETRHALELAGGTWHCELSIVDDSGEEAGGVWRNEAGDIYLPFDPNAVRDALLYERYLQATVPSGHLRARELAQRTYYRVRPLIPRRVQLAMRRRYLAAQERVGFPNWPVETALHDLDSLLLHLVQDVLGEPLPWLAPWPEPYAWALVLTHDVEGRQGYERLGAVLDREVERDLRSGIFFVPERDYRVAPSRLRELRDLGFEVGLHGLRHDGRDLAAVDFENRLPAMRQYAVEWEVDGFRSPATHRDRQRLGRLGVAYDSSYCDVARFEPQPGGACTWLPYFLGSMVELPITMPMDHLLFELFEHESDDLWVEKAQSLRRNGGMALMLTHPDYLLEDARLDVYAGFLDRWSDDDSVWHPLPRDVAGWWRERASTSLARGRNGWSAVGSAASRARVMTGAPARPAHLDTTAHGQREGVGGPATAS